MRQLISAFQKRSPGAAPPEAKECSDLYLEMSSLDAPTLSSQNTDHARATKSLSKKCKSRYHPGAPPDAANWSISAIVSFTEVTTNPYALSVRSISEPHRGQASFLASAIFRNV